MFALETLWKFYEIFPTWTLDLANTNTNNKHDETGDCCEAWLFDAQYWFDSAREQTQLHSSSEQLHRLIS